MSAIVANTSANLSGDTIITAENADTITGLKTFDRDPAAPFAVSSGSAKVDNLDADLLDGISSATFARWDGGGTSLGQIAFPATQSASSGANVLDDYEEGSWTPVIGGSGGTSGQSYTTQIGLYVKIGQLVVANFHAVLSAKGTITTNVQLQGLPFTSLATSNSFNIAPLQWGTLATNWVSIVALVEINATTALIRGANAAAASNNTALTTADINNTSFFTGTIIYRASA